MIPQDFLHAGLFGLIVLHAFCDAAITRNALVLCRECYRAKYPEEAV